MLVTLVGHDILAGRALQRTTTATDYANFIVACLTHDIGYVRGIVQGDEDGAYVADLTGRKIELPVGSSDAALAPYHVDRSKLFVIERLDDVEVVDAARIARAIEYTRFPYATTPKTDTDDLNEEEGLLLRAADLIGQLGDPNYIRKANALFHEFDEIGLNKTLGYGTPADIVYKFPQFYWANVAPQIQLAIRYLNVTSSGRQWIAPLLVMPPDHPDGPGLRGQGIEIGIYCRLQRQSIPRRIEQGEVQRERQTTSTATSFGLSTR